MRKTLVLTIGASLTLAPFFSAYAVNVVDSSSTQQIAQEAVIKANNAANAELFNQLQLLQEEVMRTRGLLEEQQQQLQELKEQRLEDYKSIDKRLTELSQKPSSVDASLSSGPKPVEDYKQVPDATTSQTIEPVPGDAINPNQQDILDYQKAYELIKQRKFDLAKESFIAFIAQYPGSEYEPNAHYWLGELYIIEGDFVKAKTSFQTILKKYPQHTKHPEALYKIATVNYELGDRTTAKLQMEQLIQQYGDKPVSAVAKARDFLKTNYP
jgi:tol-pal system protein YbgF